MTTQLFGADDKLSTSGGSMTGTLAFQGTPPYTLVSGSGGYIGTATLNGTTAVVVSCPQVTSSSLIFLTIQAPAGTPGAPYVASITAGTGFTVKSSAGDTSAAGWMVVSHA
jgi:hypothetical protein